MPAELSEAAAFEIIPQVPGYEVLGELGRGGMGVVYKARQIGLERIVALKMILAGAQASPRELARFRAEAEAVARLQHPNIVQIHEVGEYRGCPYFSLEFVDGGSLDQILHGQALAPHSAAKVVQSLPRAVHYAHQHGIIHRDLKPGNILLKRPEVGGCGPYQCQLRGECTPKITDFGLAKRLDATTLRSHRDAIAGTPKCFRKRFLTSGLQPEVL